MEAIGQTVTAAEFSLYLFGFALLSTTYLFSILIHPPSHFGITLQITFGIAYTS